MRVKWIDYSKGFLILLVLIGHVVLGLVRSGNYPNCNGAMRSFLELIYGFHMPLFFALSGYFFKSSSSLKEWFEMVKKKLISLGIPYVVFSIIMFVLQSIGGESVRNASSFSQLLKIYMIPIGYLWFLYTLFFIFCFVGLISIKIKDDNLIFTILLTGYIIASIFNFKLFFLQRFLVWAPFFFSGKMLKDKQIDIDGKCVVAGILYIIHVPIFRFLNPTLDYISQSNPKLWGIFSFIGIYLGFALFKRIFSESFFSKKMEHLGRSSMIVYLVHVPVASVFRILLYKIGIYNLGLNIVIGILLTLAVSIISIYLSEKIKLVDFVFYPLKYIKLR